MLNEITYNKLVEMRMTAMADAYRLQLEDSSIGSISFEDRIGMLVDTEYCSRKTNRLNRLMYNATFDQPQACIADINYSSGRKLDKTLILRLAVGDYIREAHCCC